MAKHGVTLLELLLVLGVLGALLALGLSFFSPSRLALDQAARSLAAQVNRARLEAIRQNAFVGLHVFTEAPGATFSSWTVAPTAAMTPGRSSPRSASARATGPGCAWTRRGAASATSPSSLTPGVCPPSPSPLPSP